ncbi:MAG: hypothetical protein HY240_11250 [Actinobacteria bacterium]|nr:hypothetical protein [Actinomycetota bacterium]
MDAGGGKIRARAERYLGTAVWEAKTIAAQHPALATPLARLRGHGELLAPSTQILIEAFVRSGLSFTVAAFRLAQEPAAVEVAHHTHSPSAVIDAARRGIPTLLLVREPEDAVLSYLVKTPTVSMSSAIRGYIRFHRPLLAYREGFVTASFRETTDGGLGAVIDRVNERFGTSFVPFAHTEANVAEVFRRIDADWTTRGRDDAERQRGAPRPSEARDAWKRELLGEYRDRANARLRASAELLFRTFAATAA